MFCAKLKELKISGECPFSVPVRNAEAEERGDGEEGEESRAQLSEHVANVAPRRKTSRNKVNLHSLGESVRKLVCPEVMNIPLLTSALIFHSLTHAGLNHTIISITDQVYHLSSTIYNLSSIICVELVTNLNAFFLI